MAGNKLSDKEIKDRIKKAYDLRYNEKYTQERYVQWAKEEYGDKSEQQYCQYFSKSRKYHEEVWKDLLEQQLKPATLELIRLMADEDPKVRQRAIDQIFKYTGNDITKVQAEVSGEVKITFGDE
jgi:hypothetical protein